MPERHENPEADLAERVAYYIERLRGGDDDAWYRLVEAEDAAVPLLIHAACAETDAEVRAELVEIIGQHRLASTVGFLAQCLEDRDIEVRQQAIDGLLAISSADARRALQTALERCRSLAGDSAEFGAYLQEAIELMDEWQR